MLINVCVCVCVRVRVCMCACVRLVLRTCDAWSRSETACSDIKYSTLPPDL